MWQSMKCLHFDTSKSKLKKKAICLGRAKPSLPSRKESQGQQQRPVSDLNNTQKTGWRNSGRRQEPKASTGGTKTKPVLSPKAGQILETAFPSLVLFSQTEERAADRTHLEVSFGGEGSPTDGAGKGLLPGVGALVDLQGAGRGEVLPTGSADVLFGRTAELGAWHQQRGHPRGQGWGANEVASAEGTIAGQLHLYQGRRGSDKSSWDTAPTWRENKGDAYPNLILLPSLKLAETQEPGRAHHTP